MIYGLPYKGSKNAIAERIVATLPSGEHFVDCCCGGGAILQAAAMSGKYKTVTGYDINKAIVGLIEATMINPGTIDYEHKILPVTKEQFYESRNRNETLDDWLNRYIASFGYNGQEYLWGENRIKYKTLQHQALTLPTFEGRRNALRDLLTAICKDHPSDDDLKNLCNSEQATSLSRFQRVEEEIVACKNLAKMRVFVSSMFDIPFEKYDVIYFDPPYHNTKGYNRMAFSFIMFKALLRTLVEEGKTVFVSEYDSPADGYTEIWSAEKMMTQQAEVNRKVTERLFYGGTKESYEALPGVNALDNSGVDTAVHVDTDGGTESDIPGEGLLQEVCSGTQEPVGHDGQD
jgi:site-specific DNA-adenine methylase